MVVDGAGQSRAGEVALVSLHILPEMTPLKFREICAKKIFRGKKNGFKRRKKITSPPPPPYMCVPRIFFSRFGFSTTVIMSGLSRDVLEKT